MDDTGLNLGENDTSNQSSNLANSLRLDSSPNYPGNVTLASLTTENPYLQDALDANGNMLPQYQGQDLLFNVSPWEKQFAGQDGPPYALPGGSSLYSNQTSLISQADYSTDALLNPDAYIDSSLLHNNPYLQGTLDANGNLLPEYQSDAQRILSGVSLPDTGQIPTTPNPPASAPNADSYPTQYSIPTPPTGYEGVVPQTQLSPLASPASQSATQPDFNSEYPWTHAVLQKLHDIAAPVQAFKKFLGVEPMSEQERSDMVSPLTSLPDQFSAMGNTDTAQEQADSFRQNYGIDTPEKIVNTLTAIGLLSLGAKIGMPEIEAPRINTSLSPSTLALKEVNTKGELAEMTGNAMGGGYSANPGTSITDAMKAGLYKNFEVSQYNLNLANKGLNRAGKPIDFEQQQRVIKAATDRMNEIRRVLASGIQAQKK